MSTATKQGMERASKLAEKGMNTAMAKAAETAVGAPLDFAADAGMGMEGADKASFAVPFLVVLQSNSPQLELVEGAKAGMFINSVTNELFTEVQVVPVAFQRRYLAWAPRSSGGGFKGEHTVAEVEGKENVLKWAMKPDHNGTPQMTLPDGSVLKDTRNHFVLVVSAEGSSTQALFSFASTQIKKSKKWMSRIQAIQLKDAGGAFYNPPSFSHVYKCTTVSEENDKGKWKGVLIDLVGPVTDRSLYQAAKDFHALIVAGKVEVSAPPAGGVEGEGDSEKF